MGHPVHLVESAHTRPQLVTEHAQNALRAPTAQMRARAYVKTALQGPIAQRSEHTLCIFVQAVLQVRIVQQARALAQNAMQVHTAQAVARVSVQNAMQARSAPW
jgi:hypothetical protein